MAVDKFPMVHVRGTPAQMGEQHGQQALSLIERALDYYLPRFEARGYARGDVIALGRAFAKRIGAVSPALYEELEGIAHGCGRDLGEIVALNARTELLYGDPVSSAERGIEADGCTGAIALPAATADGHVLHGQNWDWREESAELAMVIMAEPADGPRFLTLVEAGTLARCGLNEAGIAITGNFLKASAEFAPDGLPAPFIRRTVLGSSNLHDALGSVICTPRSFSINVMISHAEGEAFDLETTPEHVFWLRAENDLLVHANHFVSEAARARLVDLGLAVSPDSLYRDIRVRRHLARAHGCLRMEDFRDAFADRFGEPYGVCRAPSTGPGGDRAASVASVIMDVTVGQLRVAARPWLGAKYWSYDFDGREPSLVEWRV